MKGEVRQLGGLEGGGLIMGEDGNRYSFLLHEWKAAHVPVVGTAVDFVAADGVASEVYPLPNAPLPVELPAFEIPPSNASLFAGIGMGLLVLSFIIPVLPSIAALIFGLLGASSAKRHKNRNALIFSRIAWIGSLVTLVLAGRVPCHCLPSGGQFPRHHVPGDVGRPAVKIWCWAGGPTNKIGSLIPLPARARGFPLIRRFAPPSPTRGEGKK